MPSLSILIPAFNEAERLPRTLELVKIAKEKGIFNASPLSEVWVIDDGSRDQTSQIAINFSASLPEIRVHQGTPNQGKGNAIHAGLHRITSDWCLIADADSATPWDQFIPLSRACQDGEKVLAHIAFGSRDVVGSLRRERQSRIRENLGRLFNLAVRILTGLSFKDTQCGFKLIHMPSVRPFVPHLNVKRFAWDVEFLLFSKKHRLTLREVPVVWEHQEGSRISPLKDGIEMILRVIQMRIRIALLPGPK